MKQKTKKDKTAVADSHPPKKKKKKIDWQCVLFLSHECLKIGLR